MSKLDVSKLEFKDSVKQQGLMTIKIDSLQKLVPISREQLLVAVDKGYHLDKLHGFFTPQSILLAKEEPKPKKKITDEGVN